MPEESIEVVPSEDGGNGLPPETPSVTPSEPVVPADENKEPVTTTENTATPELFELPDGRKVDAATLSKEWKENFYPDYTRKSQALAAKDTSSAPLQPNPATNPLDDPSWQPASYGELVKIAKEQALLEIEQKEQQRIDHQKSIEDAVTQQLADVKAVDPNVNENALFLHATKYGFRDLKLAHQNMKDMSETVKKVQTTTAQNIARRSDPVSVSPGSTGIAPNPSNFATAREYVRSLK